MPVPLRLERTLLFVPGNHRRMIEKAAQAPADAVCLDLEDAVAEADKAAARAVVAAALAELDFGRRLRLVRINGLDTAWAYRDLVDVVEAAGDRIDLIMLPKASGPGDVEFVDRLLRQIEAARGFGPIGLEAQIENARGFAYAREIAAAAPRLEALIFGPGDFAASMRMPSTGIGDFDANDALYPGHRWHGAMLTIVAAARANGLRCLDGPYAAFRDDAGFARSCQIARVMGFDGKQCIHPAQLEAARAAFTPSAEEAAQADRILAAYAAAAAAGKGAASLDGKMIDAANLRLARGVAARAALCRQADQGTPSHA
jgi:citrate lyase beta subunit